MVEKSRYAVALDEVQSLCAHVLRPIGFRKRGRSFNRNADDDIVQVVTLFAMPYWSSQYGTFNVEVGVTLPCVATIEGHIPYKTWFQTSDCALRTDLWALNGKSGSERWSLRRPGKETAQEIVSIFSSVGIPFFERFHSYSQVLAHFEEYGALPGSNPDRSALEAAVVYQHLGKTAAARQCFLRALRSKHREFAEHVDEIRRRCLGTGA